MILSVNQKRGEHVYITTVPLEIAFDINKSVDNFVEIIESNKNLFEPHLEFDFTQKYGDFYCLDFGGVNFSLTFNEVWLIFVPLMDSFIPIEEFKKIAEDVTKKFYE